MVRLVTFTPTGMVEKQRCLFFSCSHRLGGYSIKRNQYSLPPLTRITFLIHSAHIWGIIHSHCPFSSSYLFKVAYPASRTCYECNFFCFNPICFYITYNSNRASRNTSGKRFVTAGVIRCWTTSGSVFVSLPPAQVRTSRGSWTNVSDSHCIIAHSTYMKESCVIVKRVMFSRVCLCCAFILSGIWKMNLKGQK